jgi:SAM-dependent methyltransferase
LSQYGGYDEVEELAALYDCVPSYVSRADVSFYLDLCREAPGAVLELGCGTGRLLIPAAQAGCSITGLDQSSYMLERCRSKVAQLPVDVQQRVTLVQGNMVDFHLHRTYGLITIPFRPLQHLVTVEEQLRCLSCVREHLAPRGRLAFDVFHVNPTLLAGPVSPEEVEDFPELTLPDGRFLRRAFRFVARRRSEQCNDIEIIYYVRAPGGETRRIVQAFPFRYFCRFELEHLLARAGLRTAALYGDFDRSRFADDSAEMIFVAEREG